MKWLLRIVAVVVIAFASLIGWAFFRFSQLSSAKFSHASFSIHEEVTGADLELGRRIYSVRNGCIDCHGADLAGAKIMDNLAMGTIYGSNITPFNLKDWTDEQIAAAIRYGVHKDGRSLRFMPAFDFAKLSKSDVAAVVAYLRSVETVFKENHANSYGPVAKVMSALGEMPVMFPAFAIDQKQGFIEKPAEGPTAEFGRYLAYSCTGCHRVDFVGGKIPGGDPSWLPAANIRFGADSFWTEEKFREMIKTGISPKLGRPLKPPMPIALLKQFNETEIKALWEFLSGLK